MIADIDISVIIAGKIDHLEEFDTCVKSIRDILPNSKIIVSTWDDTDVNEVNYVLIKNKNIEPLKSKNGEISNITRQILLVKAALKCVKTEYVLKFRPDLILYNKQIIRNYKKDKIVVTNLFVPNPFKDPTLFHISDVVQFSTYDNIKKFWDLDIKKINNDKIDNLKIFGNFSGYTNFKMLPEQILTINFFNKELNSHIELPYINYADFNYLNLWIDYVFHFFIILNYSSSGVVFPGRFFKTRYKRHLLDNSHKDNFLFKSNSRWIKKIRYAIFNLNKYFLCWLNRNYYFSLLHICIGILKGRKK